MALSDTYRSYKELQIFLNEELDIALGQVTSESSALKIVIYELIDWAESKGKLDNLYDAFLEENPEKEITRVRVKSYQEPSLLRRDDRHFLLMKDLTEGYISALRDREEEMQHEARQSEGQIYAATMNRMQQAFYVENVRFAKSLDELKAGVPDETDSYRYTTQVIDGKAVSLAQSRDLQLRSFKGVVHIDEKMPPYISSASLYTTSEPGMLAEEADRSIDDSSQPRE